MSVIKFAPTSAKREAALDTKIKSFLKELDFVRDEHIALRDRYSDILSVALHLAESLDEYDDIDFDVNRDFPPVIDREGMVPILTGRDSKSVDYLIVAVPAYLIDMQHTVDLDGPDSDGIDEEDPDGNTDEDGYLKYYNIAYRINDGHCEILTEDGWEETNGKRITWYSDSQKDVLEKGGAESEFLQTLVKSWGPMPDKHYTAIKEKFEPLLKLYEKMDGMLRFGASTDEDEGQVFLMSAQPNLVGVVIGCYDGQCEVSQYISSDIASKIVMDSPSSSHESLNCEDFYNPVGALSFDEAMDYCNKVFGVYVPDGKCSFVFPLSLEKSVRTEMRDVEDVREVLLDALDSEKDLSGEEDRARADLREYIDVL